MMGGISVLLLAFLEKSNSWQIPVYIAGFIGNEVLNRVLKPMIQDPRPVPISPTDTYGMPSGHSQLAAYSLVFITLALREKHYGWILLFVFLTVATMAQRVITQVHSLEQVIVGGLLGGIIGYLLQKIGKKI
jgi:membrane-associated phospholipid phosphatase